MQLPETFLEQMKLLLGTDYDAWLESAVERTDREVNSNLNIH